MGFPLGSSNCCPTPLLRPNALVPSHCNRGLAVWAHRKPQEETGTPPPPPPPAVRGSWSCSRRRAAAAAVVLLGASASCPPSLLPLADALQVNQDSIANREPGSVLADGIGKAESFSLGQTDSEAHLGEAGTPLPSVLAVLNSIGVMASGVLGALYLISRQDKAAIESDIQTMKSLLGEKEAAITSIKNAFDEKMLNEKQILQKRINTLKEEEATLSSQLASANATISGLGHELRSHRRYVSEFQQKLDQLQSSLTRADEEKRRLEGNLKDKANAIDFLQDRVGLLSLEAKDKEKSIQLLRSSLADKQSECERLSSLLVLAKAEHENSRSLVEQLKIEIARTQEELDSSNGLVSELNGRLNTITKERDEASQKLLTLQDDYKTFKSASMSKENSDAKLLSAKDEEIRQLDEKLALSLNEAETTQALVVKLGKERDRIGAMLEEETNKVETLQLELQHAHESLRAAKLEASTWETQLEVSERRCQELESKIARIQMESSDAELLLKNSLDEAQSASRMLSNELAVVRDALIKTEEELRRTSDELGAVVGDQGNLKIELVEVYKRAENTAQDLKEERKKVNALNQELEASVNQIQRDSETMLALENGLKEATKSLDEMNQRASTLSREVENAGTRIKSLEEEKEVLYNTLLEQNKVTLEAQENIEDAQNLIMRLGGERESLEKRSKSLEEDLAAAKGEILKMRRDRSVGNETSDRNQSIDEKEATTSAAKRNGSRRKRTEPPSEGSQ